MRGQPSILLPMQHALGLFSARFDPGGTLDGQKSYLPKRLGNAPGCFGSFGMGKF
jgi:hypothetical protein